MPKEGLFEQFNAVKQQIQGHVEGNTKEPVVVDKQESIKTASANTTTDATSDKTNTDSDDTGGMDEFSMDAGDSNPEGDSDSDADTDADIDKQGDVDNEEDKADKSDQDKDQDKQEQASEESFKQFTAEALHFIKTNEQISLGFEQLQLLQSCFDDEGDLNLSQESLSLVKSQQWITGHQLLLSDTVPTKSTDVYYASESLKDTLASIVKWVIRKIADMIKWVYDVVVNLNETFSYDSMMDRFKSYNRGAEVKQSFEDYMSEFIAEHDRLTELVKKLAIRQKASQVKFAALYQQAMNNPKAMEIVERMIAQNEKLNKAARLYDANKESMGLSSVLQLDNFASLIGDADIKDHRALLKVMSNSFQSAVVLKYAGDNYLQLYRNLKQSASHLDDVMLFNNAGNAHAYISANTDLFDVILSILKQINDNIVREVSAITLSDTKTNHAKAYGPLNLDTTDHVLNISGHLYMELSTIDIGSSDFKRIGKATLDFDETPTITSFKQKTSDFYGFVNSSISSLSKFRCYYKDVQAKSISYIPYNDPSTAATFYSTYMTAAKFVKESGMHDELKKLIDNTKVLGKELNSVQSNAKSLDRDVRRYTDTKVKLLNIFEDKSQEAQESLEQSFKKTITQTYLQMHTYVNVTPLAHAVICYRNGKYAIEKTEKLFAKLTEGIVNVERVYKRFQKLAGIIVETAYELRPMCKELQELDIDPAYFSEMAEAYIREWTTTYESIDGYKKKVVEDR